MGTNLGGPPESLVKALSKPNSKNADKAAGQLLSWASSQSDKALVQRSVLLMRKVISVVKEALPDTDPELIGGFFANLLDLWETGKKLDKELQNLKKLRLPKDREALRNTLLWIDAIQLDMASYWIEEIEKDLPKLLKALDKLERKSVHRTARRRRQSSARRAQQLPRAF